MNNTYDVLIAGGGPVGAALAVNLGLRGISCALIERHTKPQLIPKGQNLLQRSVEQFWFWGLEPQLRAARIMPKDFPMSGITAYGSLDTEWWYAPPLREALNKFFLLENERLPQYQLEDVLRKKLKTIVNVTTFYGHVVENVAQSDDNVEFKIINTKSGTCRILNGKYAVGCDGSHSTVRQQTNIARSGTDYEQPMVLAVFRSRQLSETLSKKFPLRSTYRVMKPSLEGYWQFFGRVNVEESWFFHSPIPPDVNRDNFDFLRLLHDAAGFEFSCNLDHVGFWDLQISVADKYNVGRIFIAGDAAHSHPPYGGYGLNAGLEDAANLAWKLEACLKGWGGSNLLDSYSVERQPIFEETGRDFIAGRIEADRIFFEKYNPEEDLTAFKNAWGEKKLQNVADFVLTYEPHYEGSPIVDGNPGAVCSAHGSHSLTARAGHHLAPQSLSNGRNVYQELNHGFTLIALDISDSAVSSFENLAKRYKFPLNIVRDTYAQGRKQYEKKLILVRPDQFIAWCDNEVPTKPQKLIEKVLGK